MTDWVAELTEEAKEIFSKKWSDREGRVVPDSEDVALTDGAVKIEATFLYADLAASSKLAQHCPWGTTAKIVTAYLHCCTRLIRAYGGHIRSFDGDRVMGVFTGDLKNTHATRCAREIFWATTYVLAPTATATFSSIRNNSIIIRQCVGIDTGEAIAVRAGIRNNNDLVWIGRAPSLAAKLSDIREYPFCVYVSDACFKKLGDPEKQSQNTDLWEPRSLQFGGKTLTVHRTNWWRRP